MASGRSTRMSDHIPDEKRLTDHDVIPNFRKKPVVIKAFQVPKNPSDCAPLMDWLVACCDDWCALENGWGLRDYSAHRT